MITACQIHENLQTLIANLQSYKMVPIYHSVDHGGLCKPHAVGMDVFAALYLASADTQSDGTQTGSPDVLSTYQKFIGNQIASTQLMRLVHRLYWPCFVLESDQIRTNDPFFFHKISYQFPY